MANEIKICDEALVERIRPLLKHRKGYSERRMFGGFGFLLNHKTCCGSLRQYLIVRLGVEGVQEALRLPHTHKFDVTRKIMADWVMVGPDGYRSDEALASWVNQAAKFVSSMLAKQAGRKVPARTGSSRRAGQA